MLHHFLFKLKLHTYKIVMAITNEQINISQGHTIEMHTTTTHISNDTWKTLWKGNNILLLQMAYEIQTNNHRSEFKMLFDFTLFCFFLFSVESILMKIRSNLKNQL